MNPFQSLDDYEEYIYTLPQKFPSIKTSNLVVIRRGRRVAKLQGELTFARGYRVTISERLSHESDGLVIETYGYELWHNAKKIGWYDSQPHPNDPTLASSHPHHKHILPDIKKNRIPAPSMSFNRPNLPVLMAEIETLIKEVA
jgi:hypothetical protein